MAEPDLNEVATFFEELAAESGKLISRYYREGFGKVILKEDSSPVTVADREAEILLRERISAKYPGHGILGEEYGLVNEDAEWRWVLDPIDGTKSFVAGCPLFGTLIGLCRDGIPVMGAIHQPVVNQLLIGDCEKTYLNGKKVQVRKTSRLRDATLLTTDLGAVEQFRDGRSFEHLQSRAAMFRTWGDCYGYLLVATGGADIMVDPMMNPWDLLPLIPVIKGAGGVITSWEGHPAHEGHSCVACVPELHKDVLEVLNYFGQAFEG